MKKVIKRSNVIIIIFIACIFILLIRLGYIQIIKSSEYVERAYELWTRNIPVNAKRGKIYDRNGKLIVGNTLSPTISIIPKQVVNKNYTINTISTILNIDKEKLSKHFDKNVSVEIIKPEAKNITLEQAKMIIAADLKGVYVAGDVVRYYPYGNYLSHVLGIVGSDFQGITGIEYIYDDYLLGIEGSQKIYTDAHGNLIKNANNKYKPSTAGFDIYLTIDIDVQVALERVLDNAEAMYEMDKGIGLVLEPNTSEILAIASRPNYDLVNYQDYNQEIFNRNLPIWMSFEPGSVFKTMVFAAGLEEEVFSLEERFYDPGYIIVDKARIRDWKAGGHGDESFEEVLQNSCNPGFVTIGLRLGKERLFKYIREFGFGKRTGVDLLGESSGIVFNEENIGNVELATSAFGQGNSTTAIQLVNATCCVVNGGKLNKPYILKGFGIKDTNTLIFQNETKYIRDVISKETSDMVRSSLEKVVALGTARGAYIEGYRVGGKTGTSQVAENGVYLDNKYILSFLGIAPMNDPKITVYIALDNPKNCIQYGGTTVAPLVREVLVESLILMNIEKQEGGIAREARWWVDKFLYQVDNYVGLKVSLVRTNPYYKIKIEGNGDIIIAQNPKAGEKIIQDGVVTLYTNNI